MLTKKEKWFELTSNISNFIFENSLNKTENTYSLESLREEIEIKYLNG
jgi:hypothetical protein